MSRTVLIGLLLPAMLCRPAHAAEPKPLEQARIHLQKGRYAEAVEAYEQLTARNADPAAVALGLSRAHAAQGNYDKAAAVIQAALESAADSSGLWARRAELHYQGGEYQEAEAAANRALRINAEEPIARLVRADVYTATGRIKEADEEYRWFVRYYNSKQPKDAETLLLVAEGAAQYARWNRSSQIFHFIINTLCPEALKADPLQWRAAYVSGRLLLEKYNRAQALPEFDQALAINPQAAEVYVAQAEAALQQLDLKQADTLADRALAINPRLVWALRLKADVRLAQDDPVGALQLTTAALAVDPHDQRTLARAAACYLLQDGFPAAEEWERLLSMLEPQGRRPDSLPSTRFAQLLAALAGRNPRPGYFLTALGEALEARRRFAAAERLYVKAAEVMPQLSEPKTALGMLYMRIGKTAEARRVLDEAFQADRFHVRVSNLRKVLDVLSEYQTITTEHFVIHFDSQADAILGPYMAEYLEEIYPELVEQFGFEPPGRTHFEIYHNAKGQTAHQWFSARMVGLPWIQTVGASTGMIVALASPTAAEQPFNWARVLRHEFVHVITLQQTDFNIPHWLTEALAVTAEGSARPEIWNRLLLERVPAGELRTLDNLTEGFVKPQSPLDWQFAYCQSRLYAQYMSERFGSESIRKLLEAYRRNLSTPEAIRAVFGVEPAEFEAGYRKFLEQIVADLRQSAPPAARPLDELERLHRADPRDARLAAEYAHALWQARQRDEARRLAEKAQALNPSEPLAAVVLANLDLREEKFDAAAARLEAVLDPEQPDYHVLLTLAQVKLLAGRAEEAAELYRRGQARFPEDVAWAKGAVAAYLKLEQTDRLVETLERLMHLDPEDAFVRRKLAEVLLAAGKFDRAARAARLALHIDVRDVEAHRLLAAALHGQKQYDRAVREYLLALELRPDDAELEFGLAKALAAQGKRDQARRRLEDLLGRNPDHSGAAELLKSLSAKTP